MSRSCQNRGSNAPELGSVLSASAGDCGAEPDLVPQRKHTQQTGESPKELLNTALPSAHVVGQGRAQTSRVRGHVLQVNE